MNTASPRGIESALRGRLACELCRRESVFASGMSCLSQVRDGAGLVPGHPIRAMAAALAEAGPPGQDRLR